MAAKYRLGDRVEAIVSIRPYYNDYILAGSTGTVCDISYGPTHIGVAWDDEFPGGHDCGESCQVGRGWYVYPKYIIPYEEEATEDIDEDSFLKIIV